jgi:fluoroquinolone transport system permease protein
MKAMILSFKMLFWQVLKDGMLIAACIAPVLAACLFRFGIPVIERLLCAQFQVEAIIRPYYLLIDLMLALMTPYLFCFASAMVLLTEYDEHMSGYLAVTPIGKGGYLLSRLILPAAVAFFASLALLLCFSLTSWSLPMAVSVCFLFSLQCVDTSLLLFAFSHNRVEGMALAKAAGLMLLGLPVPFVFPEGFQYFFAPLPSFWTAKFAITPHPLFLLAGLATALLWLYALSGKMIRKLAAG